MPYDNLGSCVARPEKKPQALKEKIERIAGRAVRGGSSPSLVLFLFFYD